jgi:hypothetical protein
MRLPTQSMSRETGLMSTANLPDSTSAGIEMSGVLPSSCCDGKVSITSPSGDVLYNGTSGCCYDGGQAYCYPCSGETATWEAYAKLHFSACQGPTPCAIALTGCGSLTPYC